MRVLQIVDGTVTPFTKYRQRGYIRHRIISELTRLAEGYKDTGWKLADPVEAFHTIKDEFTFVLLESGGIMAVSSNVPWFAQEHVLCEEWLGAGVTTTEAASAMKAICKQAGIRRFEVGTRAVPNQKHSAAARLYQRDGLRLTTITLEGVMNDEQEDVAEGNGSVETA